MIVTPTTKSITQYTLTLSEEDARAAMADPYSFGDLLAEQLRSAGVAPGANGAGDAPSAKARRTARPGPRSQIRLGKTGKKSAAKNSTAARQGATKGGLTKLECPQCQHRIAEKYMRLHQEKKHGVATPASPTNGAHPEAAAAAV